MLYDFVMQQYKKEYVTNYFASFEKWLIFQLL